MQIVAASEIAEMIFDNATVIPGGFGCCGHPDLYTEALQARFESTGHPKSLNLLFASGAGDKAGKGLDRLAAKGMVKQAIGGFWGFCPELSKAAREGQLEGHNWPMGTVSHLFREIASGSPGVLTKVGLSSFVDPDVDGGCLTQGAKPIVQKTTFMGEEYMFYPSQKVDFTILRGTYSDAKGNISMEDEDAYHDAMIQAMAAKRYGGKVAVQVKKLVDKIPPNQVQIPAVMVDYVTVCDDEANHPSSYGILESANKETDNTIPLEKRLVLNRAIKEMPEGKNCINLGIGIPALIGEQLNNDFGENSLTVESGLFNGTPLYELSFGASDNPDAVIDQADLFTFYDGGGIDVAFLGFGEIDAHGRLNSSMFGKKQTGAGGFINIAQSAKKIVLCGTMTTAGLKLQENNGELQIINEGKVKKFVSEVQQITVDTSHSLFANKEILVITERAVFNLSRDGLELIEIAPGVSIAEVTAQIDYPISISPSLKKINLV
ncbi:CoA-transferase [Alteromonas sp. a30]|uniref:CoA-transferase n=1 Tax=Alteromonas sp. a30 TaxID=2730917 RepID=UPI002280CB34|nr:CoA-transferase [Alteromonas sp. a30]MCY7295414.1 acyl CoA:acetate/3-ketoacid CoA transferase [Alteromonas sp. a30]